MKILIDQDISHIEELLTGIGQIVKRPGRDIQVNDLKGIDALIVRSVTTVDAALIENADCLKFVGSVTSGDDHIDKVALDARHITHYVAKGCNAPAVVSYVLCAVAALQQVGKLQESPTIAIVGVGCVGGLLAAVLKKLGFSVLLYDPPRARGFLEQDQLKFCCFQEVLTADLICLHVPLTQSGDDPTYHLISADVMKKLKKDTVVLNAARGAVVDNQAIKSHGQHLAWCLDVWENEPMMDLEVLQQAFIATPHIAGYSQESQQRAAVMVCQALCRRFDVEQVVQLAEFGGHKACLDRNNWQHMALGRLDLLEKTAETREALLRSPEQFDSLRKLYRDMLELPIPSAVEF